VMLSSRARGQNDEYEFADGVSLVSQARSPVAVLKSAVRLLQDRGGVPVTNNSAAGYTAHIGALLEASVRRRADDCSPLLPGAFASRVIESRKSGECSDGVARRSGASAQCGSRGPRHSDEPDSVHVTSHCS
jgi:hypothetical protein